MKNLNIKIYITLITLCIAIYNINQNFTKAMLEIFNEYNYFIFTYLCSIHLLVRFVSGKSFDLSKAKHALESIKHTSTYFLAIPLALTLLFNEILIFHYIISLDFIPNPLLSKIIYFSSAPILLFSILLSSLIIYGSVMAPVMIQTKIIIDIFVLCCLSILLGWSLDFINIYTTSSILFLISIVFANFLVLIKCKTHNINIKYILLVNKFGPAIHHILIATNILILIIYLLPKSTDFVDPNWSLILLTTVVLFYLLKMRSHEIVERKRRFFTDNLLLIIAIFLISLKNPISYEPGHYSFILLPVYSLIAGASPLVDINSQYGIGILYFISSYFWWNPLLVSFSSMAVLVNILNIVFYILLLYIAWKLTNKSRLQSIILVLLIIFNRFTQYGSPEDYPSTGALRFGLPYIILYSHFFGNINSNYLNFSVVRVICIAVSSIWSAEVFVWTLACELTIQAIYEISRKFLNRLEISIRRLVIYVGKIIGIIFVAHTILYIDIFRRSGKYPDWRHYTEFLGVYGEGFGFSTPDVRTVFPILYILLCCTIIYLINEILISTDVVYNIRSVAIVIGAAALGLLQMSYYVFRSHSNNIYHIMWPPSIILLFWLSRIISDGRLKAWTARARFDGMLAFGLAFVLVTAGTGVATRDNSEFNKIVNTLINKNITQSSLYDELLPQFGIHAPAGEAKKLRAMVESVYRNEDWGPVVIAEPDLVASAFLGSGRRNMIALPYEPEDNLINSGREAALASIEKIPLQSKIIVSFRNMSLLRSRILERLCKRGQMSLIEKNDFLYLVRLEKVRENGEAKLSDICRNPGQYNYKLE